MKLASVHLARCGSTSAVAAAWVRAGGALPAVFSAEVQLGGRGQWGRRWQSPPGGVWFTLALAGHPGGPALPQVAAEAVAEGIVRCVGPVPGLRVVDPNDLLVGDRKLAGLLCERLVLPVFSGVESSATLVGVGINANARPRPNDAATGEALRRPATALAAELGRVVGVAALRRACVARLLRRLTDASQRPRA